MADAETALDTLHKTVQRVIDARIASTTNPTWTEALQVINVSVFAEKLATQAAKMTDSTLAALQKRIDFTEAELAKPLDAGATTAISSELRALARSLKADARQTLVNSFITQQSEI